jgi:hypothetical protein
MISYKGAKLQGSILGGFAPILRIPLAVGMRENKNKAKPVA